MSQLKYVADIVMFLVWMTSRPRWSHGKGVGSDSVPPVMRGLMELLVEETSCRSLAAFVLRCHNIDLIQVMSVSMQAIRQHEPRFGARLAH